MDSSTDRIYRKKIREPTFQAAVRHGLGNDISPVAEATDAAVMLLVTNSRSHRGMVSGTASQGGGKEVEGR
ncbi:MAG: hypothetical protein GY869_12130 [Planctomycetes bacterium]|nr:hypothetical protein [Planctomycetota bacterium]